VSGRQVAQTRLVGVREKVHLMNDIRQKLLQLIAKFEEKYGMNSEEFNRRYEAGTLGDDMDYVEWSATLDMLAGIEEKEGI
jgi:hypothetical protein